MNHVPVLVDEGHDALAIALEHEVRSVRRRNVSGANHIWQRHLTDSE